MIQKAEIEHHAVDVARFLQYVGPTTERGCWSWLGAKSRGKGNKSWYGSFCVKGKTIRAHKFSAVTMGCGFTPGNHLDHICNNSLCVNPAHIEDVPSPVNLKRRWRCKDTTTL